VNKTHINNVFDTSTINVDYKTSHIQKESKNDSQPKIEPDSF